MITIEIVFAAKNAIWQRTFSLPKQTTAAQALAQSGLFDDYPEAKGLAMGIYGDLCQEQTPLHDGDRLEVYRELVFDPMESRRRRAAHRSQAKNIQTKTRRKPSVAASMILNRN